MNFTFNDIVNYNDVFSVDDCEKIYHHVNKPKWSFTGRSNSEGGGSTFWYMDLTGEKFFSEYLLNIIEEKTQQRYKLKDVYANGHTFGTSGSLHIDWDHPKMRTFLFYVNPFWNLHWGGKTVFKIDDEHHFVIPKPNSAVMFPALIPHYAEGTTRSFENLRITIAWKLKIKD